MTLEAFPQPPERPRKHMTVEEEVRHAVAAEAMPAPPARRGVVG